MGESLIIIGLFVGDVDCLGSLIARPGCPGLFSDYLWTILIVCARSQLALVVLDYFWIICGRC